MQDNLGNKKLWQITTDSQKIAKISLSLVNHYKSQACVTMLLKLL